MFAAVGEKAVSSVVGSCSSVTKTALLRFDGSGKVGQAAAGIVLTDYSGMTITHAGVMLGHETNNVAEATGLNRGLELAIEAGISELAVQGDSNIVFGQAFGNYSSTGTLGVLALSSRALSTNFAEFSYTLIPRERNAAADEICHAVQDGWWTEPHACASDGSAHLGYVLSLRVDRAAVEDMTRRNAIKRVLQERVTQAFPVVHSVEIARTNARPHDFGQSLPMMLTYLVHLHIIAATASERVKRERVHERLQQCAIDLPDTTAVTVTRISG